MKVLIWAALIVGALAGEPAAKATKRSFPPEDYDAEPRQGYGMPYSFGYSVKEPEYNKDFGHRESSDGKRVTGEYRVLLPDGRTQIVSYYVEGDSGFVADVRYEGQAAPYAGPPPPSGPPPRPLPPRPLPPPPERRPLSPSPERRPLPPPPERRPYSPRPEKGPFPPPPERRPYPPRERPPYPARERPPYSPRQRPPYRGPPRPSYPEKTTNPPDEPTTTVPPRTTLDDYSTPYPAKEPEYTTPESVYPDDDAKYSTPPPSEYGSKYTDRPAPANYERPATLYVDNEPVYKGFYAHYNKPEPHYIRIKEPKYHPRPRPRPYPRPEHPRYPIPPTYTVVKPKYQGPPREVERPEVTTVSDLPESVTENPVEDTIIESPIEENREEIEAERDVPELDTREPDVPEREESKPADWNEPEEKGKPHDGYSKRPQEYSGREPHDGYSKRPQDYAGREPHDGYSTKPYNPLPRPRPHERERYPPRPYPRQKGPYPPEPYVSGPPRPYKPDEYTNKVPHDGYTPKEYKPYLAQDYKPYKPVPHDEHTPKPYLRDYDDRKPNPYPPERPNYRDDYKKVVYEPGYKPTQPPSSLNGKLYYPNVHHNHAVHKFREPERRSVPRPHNHLPNAPDCHLVHGDFGARISNRRVDMLRTKLEEQ